MTSEATAQRGPSAGEAPGPRTYPAGRFQLRLERRGFGGDGGLALRVYGPLAGSQHELLRFDCFAERPHYHVGLSMGGRIDPIEAEDALEWSLSTLGARWLELLAEVGADVPNEAERRLFGAGLDSARVCALAWRA